MVSVKHFSFLKLHL